MYKPNFKKREVIVFRQFQRKGYSLFACLGREVVISVLSVATLSASKAASISDELWRVDTGSKADSTVWLADVGVTGQRAPMVRSQAARMVTVLTRADIQAASVQSVNDLLKNALGVDVRQRGMAGMQTDISMRGGTQEQIIVMLNGINICDPQTAHNVMDLPLQLSEIQRIEVLEGPAGRAYGTSSLVGAINIVTRPDHGTGAAVCLEGGSFGYASGALSAHAGTAVAAHQLSGSYSRSDGYSRSRAGRLNTDFSGLRAFYQGEYSGQRLALHWHAGLSDKGWGSSTFYATPRWQADEQYEHTTKLFTALQAETSAGPLTLHAAAYWNQFRDRYEGYRSQPDVMPFNYNRCDVYGLNLNSYVDWLPQPTDDGGLQLRTAFGAELRTEDLVSGNLGEPLFRPRHICGTDRDYTLGLNRTNISAFLEQNVVVERLAVSVGFVATKNTWSSMNISVYPGADVSCRLVGRTPHAQQQLHLFASYNSSLRLPSFTEMYYKLQGYAADPHLKPEEMKALEGGLRWQSPQLRLKACVYRHWGRHMIDWIMDTAEGSEAPWRSVNHTKVNSTGLEVAATAMLGRLLPRQRVLRQLSLSYSHISQDKDAGEGIVSQYALEYLRHKLVASLAMQPLHHVDATLTVRWQDREGAYTTFDGNVNDYRPYALADARISWHQPSFTLYAQATNLLDNRSYVDYGNVPQPGLSVVAGIRIGLSR